MQRKKGGMVTPAVEQQIKTMEEEQTCSQCVRPIAGVTLAGKCLPKASSATQERLGNGDGRMPSAIFSCQATSTHGSQTLKVPLAGRTPPPPEQPPPCVRGCLLATPSTGPRVLVPRPAHGEGRTGRLDTGDARGGCAAGDRSVLRWSAPTPTKEARRHEGGAQDADSPLRGSRPNAPVRERPPNPSEVLTVARCTKLTLQAHERLNPAAKPQGLHVCTGRGKGGQEAGRYASRPSCGGESEYGGADTGAYGAEEAPRRPGDGEAPVVGWWLGG